MLPIFLNAALLFIAILVIRALYLSWVNIKERVTRKHRISELLNCIEILNSSLEKADTQNKKLEEENRKLEEDVEAAKETLEIEFQHGNRYLAKVNVATEQLKASNAALEQFKTEIAKMREAEKHQLFKTTQLLTEKEKQLAAKDLKIKGLETDIKQLEALYEKSCFEREVALEEVNNLEEEKAKLMQDLKKIHQGLDSYFNNAKQAPDTFSNF